MSRLVVLLAFFVLLSGRGLSSGTDVRIVGPRVIVQATGVPLTDVLTRFSQATGTKIVYDAAKPRQLVTVEIDAASQAEALSQLFEGQGLSYALRLDPSGRSVDMLFLMAKGPAPASTATAAPAAVDRRQAYDAIEETPAEAEASFQEAQQQGEPIPDPLLDPSASVPAPEGNPGAPAPAPGVPVPGVVTPFSAPWQPAAPSFPQAASYPSWR